MSPSARSFIVCWFPLSFTTCFGLHGHLQVCRILHIFIFVSLRILLRCFFFYVGTHCVCWYPLSFTTCFGLRGHLQACRSLHIFIFVSKDPASLLFFFTWAHSACFPSVGRVKLLYEVLLLLLSLVYAIYGTVICYMCVFLLTCVLFLCRFSSCFLNI
jgi:hypothetical protein